MADRAERFFRWVWRINGLIILTCGGMALVAAGLMIFNIGMFTSERRTEHNVTNVAGTDLSVENLHLGSFREIRGTTYLYAPLAPSSKYIGSGPGDGLGTARNLLFFDTVTKKAHWLFLGHAQTLSSYSFITNLPESESDYCRAKECERKVLTQAMIVSFKPMAGTRDNNPKKESFAIATADGKEMVTVKETVDDLLGHYVVSPDSLIVFYTSGGAVKVMEINPVSRVVAADADLSGYK